MSLLDGYVDRDVVKHFASLMADLKLDNIRIVILGEDLMANFEKYGLKDWLPGWLTVEDELLPGMEMEERRFVDRLIAFSGTEKSILTIKEKYLALPGTRSTLKEALEKGADIRVVDDILGAMVVASRKRRNKVVYPITGYEDEGLITAAGLAKAKTVGFRNFFVYSRHLQTKTIVEAIAKRDKQVNGFIIPLKVGLNIGIGAFSSIPLLYKKGVVISGYEPMEIMQSVWMLLNQIAEGTPAAVFQRTKEVSDEIVNRSRWMLEEVFESGPLKLENHENIPGGRLKIKEKYRSFDLEG
jgi:hydrogenase expression/formation protein HypD